VNLKKGKALEGVWPNLDFERTVIDGDAMLVYTPWRGDPPALFSVSMGQPSLEDPDKVVELKAALDVWDASAPKLGEVTMDAETEDALRQLGYLD
jgi:hypothetical protein